MHISYFFAWLEARIKPKNATKASYYRTLKSFFNFLTKNNDDIHLIVPPFGEAIPRSEAANFTKELQASQSTLYCK